MTINLDPPGRFTLLESAVNWIWEQLKTLESANNSARDFIQLKTLHSAPARLKEGLIVLADGMDWDPGTGAGVYVYYSAGWHKLG